MKKNSTKTSKLGINVAVAEPLLNGHENVLLELVFIKAAPVRTNM